MNNFSFCHNVFKSRLLQRRQNMSICGKGFRSTHKRPLDNVRDENVYRDCRPLDSFVLLGFQHNFSYITGDIYLIHDPWVNPTRKMPYSRALHHDHSAATGDRTRDAGFQIPGANRSASADSCRPTEPCLLWTQDNHSLCKHLTYPFKLFPTADPCSRTCYRRLL